jgi:hypothetical protein
MGHDASDQQGLSHVFPFVNQFGLFLQEVIGALFDPQ